MALDIYVIRLQHFLNFRVIEHHQISIVYTYFIIDVYGRFDNQIIDVSARNNGPMIVNTVAEGHMNRPRASVSLQMG